MMTDTTFISLFILFGACFGFVTFSQRHLFSEGPHTAKELDGNPFFGSCFAPRYGPSWHSPESIPPGY
jgi:hypothetical protein